MPRDHFDDGGDGDEGHYELEQDLAAARSAAARAEGEAAALRRSVAELREEVSELRTHVAQAQAGVAEQARRREEAEGRAAAGAARIAALTAEAALSRKAVEDASGGESSTRPGNTVNAAPPGLPFLQAEAATLRKAQALAAAEARAESEASAAADVHAQQIAAVTRGCERLGKEVRAPPVVPRRCAPALVPHRGHPPPPHQLMERKDAYKRAFTAAQRKAAAYKAKLVQLHGLFVRAQATASDVRSMMGGWVTWFISFDPRFRPLQAVEARNMIAATRDAELSAAMKQVRQGEVLRRTHPSLQPTLHPPSSPSPSTRSVTSCASER